MQKDVLGLDVTVDDTERVRGGERRGVFGATRPPPPPAADGVEHSALAKAFARRQELHHEARLTTLRGPKVDDLYDIGMVQSGHRLGLNSHAVNELRLVGEPRVQELQDELTTQEPVLDLERRRPCRHARI